MTKKIPVFWKEHGGMQVDYVLHHGNHFPPLLLFLFPLSVFIKLINYLHFNGWVLDTK